MVPTAILAVILQSDSGDESDLFVMLVIGFLLGVYLVYDGFNTWKMARLIQDTPTEKVRSIAVGRTELEGTIREHDGTVEPPYADEECVHVRWEAERREKRTDDDGDTYYTWETIASGTETLPFDLEDDTGRVLVRADADDPEFDIFDDGHQRTITFGRGESPPGEVSEYIDRFRKRQEADEENEGMLGGALDSASDLLGNDDPLGNTSKRRRYKQTVLPVGTEAYVFGNAEPRDAENTSIDAGQEDLLEIRHDDGSDEFLIADTSEEKLQDRYSSAGPMKTVGGLVLSAVALYVLLSRYFLL